MTPEQKQEIEDYTSLFANVGWRRYVKALAETREQTLQSAPANADTSNKWHFCRGMLHQMDSTTNFEAYVLSVYAQIEADEADDGDDDTV